MKIFLLAALLSFTSLIHAGEKITIAAAADLRFALDEIVKQYRSANPADTVEIIYGSSGKFHMQIQHGAPYDMFFSADIGFPRELEKAGFAGSSVIPYATGRIVLWSASRDASKMTLKDLASPAIKKVAIANPQHAPYGKRAEEALKAQGVWESVSIKAVLGENISQTAQFVQTGNADVGIIALSLALAPGMAEKGAYFLIPDTLHQPLEQAFIILKRAENEPIAKRFSAYMGKSEARSIMTRYGFVLPAGTSRK